MLNFCRKFIVWAFMLRTGLDRDGLLTAYSFNYFVTRSKAKAYWLTWNKGA